MNNKHKKVAKLVILDVPSVGSPLLNLLIFNIVMEIIVCKNAEKIEIIKNSFSSIECIKAQITNVVIKLDRASRKMQIKK